MVAVSADMATLQIANLLQKLVQNDQATFAQHDLLTNSTRANPKILDQSLVQMEVRGERS